MKTRTDLHAGQYRFLNECRDARDYWRTQAKAMQTFANTGRWPADLAFPTGSTPVVVTPPGNNNNAGGSQAVYPHGGFIGGVWVADQSGVC
ncbi:MAG TPA: hypothetical protein VLS48_00135 [Anaerolineales bacterium]|nr:hypothetical protein [Anaerolineales bacterium]